MDRPPTVRTQYPDQPRVLLAVPGRCLGEALRASLERAGADVLGVAVTAAGALDLCRTGRPEVLVVDPALLPPGTTESGLLPGGLRAAVRSLVPGVHVVRLDSGPDGPSLAEVVEALHLGGGADDTRGTADTGGADEQRGTGPGAGVRGDGRMPRPASDPVGEGEARAYAGVAAALGPDTDVRRMHPAGVRLTGRELLVLERLCLGLDVVRISRELGITPNTGRGYVRAILTKLGVQSQVQAVVAAHRLGIVALPAPRTREGSVA